MSITQQPCECNNRVNATRKMSFFAKKSFVRIYALYGAKNRKKKWLGL